MTPSLAKTIFNERIIRKGVRTEAVVARLLIYPGIRLAVLWWPVYGPILEPGTFRIGSTITMTPK